MSIGLTTVLLFACLFTLLLLGMQISFSLLITGILFTLLMWGPKHLFVLASSMQGSLSTEVYIAIPLFILMGNILAHTGIADELFQALYVWTARLRGGLAMGTVGAGTILAAMCGSSEAGTLTVGLMALPAMLKRGYDQRIAVGSIAAGGAAGLPDPAQRPSPSSTPESPGSPWANSTLPRSCRACSWPGSTWPTSASGPTSTPACAPPSTGRRPRAGT